MCKISLWSIEHVLNYSTPNFDQISNSIEIPLVGQGPAGHRHPAFGSHYITEFTSTMSSYLLILVCVGVAGKCGEFIHIKTVLIMTSANGNIIFRVTGPLCGEVTAHGEFLSQRPVTRSFDVFFDLCLDKRLSKHSRRRWFETQFASLWRHCNVIFRLYL